VSRRVLSEEFDCEVAEVWMLIRTSPQIQLDRVRADPAFKVKDQKMILASVLMGFHGANHLGRHVQ